MFIDIGSAKIFATSFGSRKSPVIVGIGGWTGSWELWVETFAILSENWRTIGYDHRGAGATISPVESITHERLVEDVFAVLDAFSVEQCVLAAESAGALTALAAVLKNPSRISGLVIVDGMYYSKPRSENDPFAMGLKTDYPATLDRFVQACVPEADSEHLKRWGRQILDRASQEAAIALYLSAGGIDLRNDLHRITQPALILHGDADILVPLDDARRLAQLLPNARLTVLHGAGHVPTVTRPLEVVREITEFFNIWAPWTTNE